MTPGVMGARRVSAAVTPIDERGRADLLTPQEVAARLKVHPKTVIRLGIPCIMVGTGKKRPRRRYRAEVVEAWIVERGQ